MIAPGTENLKIMASGEERNPQWSQESEPETLNPRTARNKTD